MKLGEMGIAGLADDRRPLGAAPTTGCAPSTSRRCRSRGSPPTSCRSRSRCSPVADGTAIVTENVFDGRLPVRRRARPHGRRRPQRRAPRVVRGVERLSGAPVRALDVRAGAALVLAGLAADGETVVLDASTSIAGYPTSPASSGPSAPTSGASGPPPEEEWGSCRPGKAWENRGVGPEQGPLITERRAHAHRY